MFTVDVKKQHNTTGLFSGRIRISLPVLSTDKISCMLHINISWAHCILWYGTEVWYGVVWNQVCASGMVCGIVNGMCKILYHTTYSTSVPYQLMPYMPWSWWCLYYMCLS